MQDILHTRQPSPDVDRYRNKVQFPVGIDKNGVPCIGFYAGHTHRIVPCPDCKLQPSVLNEIGNALCAFFAQQGIRPYDEQSGKGLVRHIFLRRGAHSGQIMVCLVCTRAKLPHAEQLCTALRGQFPAISTILLNVNAKNTNVILGSENHILYGPGYIEDTLCGVPVRLGPLSFYQVNTLAAERLYGVAAQYAQLTPDDTLLDLYCGMGTIGLSMAEQCRELIGVEIVPEAIESAKANAARMGEAVAAKSRFFCADAGQAATQLAAEGLHPDIVMLDRVCLVDNLHTIVHDYTSSISISTRGLALSVSTLDPSWLCTILQLSSAITPNLTKMSHVAPSRLHKSTLRRLGI